MKNRAVLLVNLGSPDSPAVADVRKYLEEFLMDGCVLDAPYPIRWGIVHLSILPSRPAQSAEAYEKIWTPEGSPLVVTSRNVQRELQDRLGLRVELAMRYQNPAIESALKNLASEGIDELFVIPLFPHYAMSSFGTAVDRVKAVARRVAPKISLTFARPYYDHPAYIQALAATAADELKKGFDHLLFSFHGIPERHLRKADPTGSHCLIQGECCSADSPARATCYRAQCYETVRAFVAATGLRQEQYSVAFQSRLGRDPWIKPYTDVMLESLGKKRTRKLLVICPSFVSDCLETIEEIGLRGKETFHRAGGGEFVLIPCLNQHPLWLTALETMVEPWLGKSCCCCAPTVSNEP